MGAVDSPPNDASPRPSTASRLLGSEPAGQWRTVTYTRRRGSLGPHHVIAAAVRTTQSSRRRRRLLLKCGFTFASLSGHTGAAVPGHTVVITSAKKLELHTVTSAPLAPATIAGARA
jgi:hypothetical protein